MLYIAIVTLLLAVFGTLNVVFAFISPPRGTEFLFEGFSRRVRFLLMFVPDRHQMMVGRLLTGATLLFGAGAVMTFQVFL